MKIQAELCRESTEKTNTFTYLSTRLTIRSLSFHTRRRAFRCPTTPLRSDSTYTFVSNLLKPINKLCEHADDLKTLCGKISVSYRFDEKHIYPQWLDLIFCVCVSVFYALLFSIFLLLFLSSSIHRIYNAYCPCQLE